MLFKRLRRPKVFGSNHLAIEPFGGATQRRMPSPSGATQTISNRGAAIVGLLLFVIVLGLLNLALTLVTIQKARGVPYVADGTRFGCELEAHPTTVAFR